MGVFVFEIQSKIMQETKIGHPLINTRFCPIPENILLPEAGLEPARVETHRILSLTTHVTVDIT